MPTKYNGSISITKIKELLAAKHPSLNTSEKNGNTYLNVDVWVNDSEHAEYGTIGSIVAQPTKAERESKTKHNLGSLKLPKYKIDSNALDIQEVDPALLAAMPSKPLPF